LPKHLPTPAPMSIDLLPQPQPGDPLSAERVMYRTADLQKTAPQNSVPQLRTCSSKSSPQKSSSRAAGCSPAAIECQ
jgi:hypothetical protein